MKTQNINNKGVSVKALNFSLTYADKVYDDSIKGYAKIVFLSEYFNLAYKKDLAIDSEVFSYISEDYDLRSSRVFDYINASSEFLSEDDKKEQVLTAEFMNYVAFINKALLESKNNIEFDETKQFNIRKMALNIINDELDRDLDDKKISSEEAYTIYKDETKRKLERIDTVIYKLG